MDWFLQNHSLISVLYFIVIAIVAHLLTPSEYDWKRNSISELGAQQYENKWVMQIGLGGFGLILTIGGIFRLLGLGPTWFVEVPVLVYAGSLILTGIFCTKPFVQSEDYSKREDKLHSVFANLTGISFSAAVAVQSMVSEEFIGFALNILVLAATLLLVFSFGRSESKRGIFQRVTFIVGFLWLIFLY
ncbi:MAG: DUF998 domain-containing protein [Candidatus Thorarchaeota archaeon]|nr:MAG: DUF998 domain-containing protein [Candidatus Thorarchaeota archaeon]